MDQLSIGGRPIGEGHPPYIIAELGANHNGDMALCWRLVDAAKAAGVDAVKLQTWTSESLICAGEYARDRRYGPALRGDGPSLEQSVRQYQLGPDQLDEVMGYCRNAGVVAFASCFADREIEQMERLGAPAYKVASMDVNNPALLRTVASTGKPVLLSVGMATLGEVELALEHLQGGGPVVLLHCVSVYPTPPDLVNLRQIELWRRAFGVPVGFSDHTLGLAVPLAAVALGACVIEKHFTLDRDLAGWDHAISADPPEMRALVEGCRQVQAALGSGVRTVGPEEREKRKSFRRQLVATRALARGRRLSEDDLVAKRPGTGIRPDEMPYVIGRVLARDLSADEELAWSDLA